MELRLALGGFCTALVLSLALGPLVIPLLRARRLGQVVRDDGPARHLGKSGTPTMGGLIFLPAFALASLAWGGTELPVFLVLVTTAGFALLGFGDDYLKVGRKRSLGLRAREKLLGQFVLGFSLAVAAVFSLGRGTDVWLPLFEQQWPLGYWYLPFAALVVVGSSNAVNLTDGLDGLAAGVAVVAALAYVFVCAEFGYAELGVVAAALAGACAGFLAYNRHPARVFMGDTGSLAIGAVLGSLAVLTRTELLLVLIGGIYVWETFSVVSQVLFFRLTGRRLWRMSPYHHHLELGGWSEVKVVRTLWLAGGLLAALAVALMKS